MLATPQVRTGQTRPALMEEWHYIKLYINNWKSTMVASVPKKKNRIMSVISGESFVQGRYSGKIFLRACPFKLVSNR